MTKRLARLADEWSEVPGNPTPAAPSGIDATADLIDAYNAQFPPLRRGSMRPKSRSFPR